MSGGEEEGKRGEERSMLLKKIMFHPAHSHINRNSSKHKYTHTHTHTVDREGLTGWCNKVSNTSPPSADASPSFPGKTQGNSDTRITCTSVEAASANKESKG